MARVGPSSPATRPGADQPSIMSDACSHPILESVGCAIIGLTAEHRVQFWNTEAERIFGRSRDEVVGKDILEFLPSRKSGDVLVASIQRALADEEPREFESHIHRPDQSERVLVWNLRRQVEVVNGTVGVIACCQEITKRRPSIPESYWDDLDVAKVMPAIARFDSSGRYTEVNETYAQMLGCEPEELVGKSCQDVVHVEDRADFVEAYRQMLSNGQAAIEARGVRKDGTSLVRHGVLLKIPSPDGDFVGHHCLMRDVTERQREAALKSAHNHVLDLLTKDVALNDILADLVRSVENQIEGIACTVLLLDRQEQTLKLGVGPGLPASYLDQIDNMPIGPDASPCGIAAYTNQEVVVEDIISDPRCQEVVPIALRHGLRSCRPMPIRAQDGQLLGVFSLYLTGDSWPSESEMHWIKAAASLSGVVIERQQTREILRENEAVFQALAETVQIIPWEMDLQTDRFTYVGAQAETILGYKHDTTDWYSPSFWRETIHPDDRDRTVQHIVETMQTQDDFSCDYRMRTADGKHRWFHNVVHVERAGQGPVKLRGHIIDITRRKQAEETVAQTNKLLAALTRAQTQFISDVNPRVLFDELQNNLLALTNSAYGFIGEVLYTDEGHPYLKTQAISNIAWNEETRGFYDEFAPQGLEFFNLKTLFGTVMKSGKSVIANSPASDPRRGGTPAGHPPLESFLGIPFVRGNRLLGMIGMANRPGGYDQALVEYLEPVVATCGSIIEAYRNDQRRKVAEAALSEAHEHLEKRVRDRTKELTVANEQLRFQAQLLDSVREAVFATDLQGRVNYWGKGAYDLYGYEAHNVLHQEMKFTARYPAREDDGSLLRQAEQRGSWRGEREQQCQDGTLFWADWFISLVTDTDGAPAGFIHIVRDISSRKRAEEEIEQRKNELAHVTRLGTMGEMATGLAHEINQPLHAIANYAEGALLRVDSGILEKSDLCEALDQIAGSAQQAAEIVRRLRRFVGKFESRRSTANVNYLIRDAIKMLEFEAKRLGITIRLQLTEGLPLLRVDSVQIEQVVMNLLHNSFQAMESCPPGSRVVVIETKRSSDSVVQVSVTDSGHGFQDVPLERIFDAFFTTKEQGLGMGLAISRSIVEAHGGRLWAAPTPDRGATILFNLPIRPEEDDGDNT